MAQAQSRYRLSGAERAMLQGTWPLGLLDDRAREPRIVESAEEFLREVLVGEHLEDFVVLPKGTELLALSWEDCLPDDIRAALRDCNSATDFARQLRARPEVVERYRADIEYVDRKRQQRDILRKDKLELGKRIDEAIRMAAAGEADADLLYIAEMRLRVEAPHPLGGEGVKTVCRRDVKDVLGPYASWTLYWDRYDEGFFAGGARSGKGLHVDQVLWSNVGKNWSGHKLIAAWPPGEVSKQVALELYDVLLSPPLSERELQVLGMAAKVVLIRPGDVYLFSGGVAHAVLCVSDEICLGAYESLVTLHPKHVAHFLRTSDSEGPFCLDKYSMDEKEFRDTKDDCIDQLEDAAAQLAQGGPASAPVPLAGPCASAAPALWRGLLAALHSDDGLQRTLRDHYASCVALCAADAYFRQNLPQRVLHAAAACGWRGAAAAAPKRRRLLLGGGGAAQATSDSTSSEDDAPSSCVPRTGGCTI
ncbi:unnamed protein product [Prorocentrum cordatum]|uniref:Bifunctional lysine-specific demethylase and histidyl-hydroxylase n=1 Tax=Prorocentrum cordatum TaxID=2364126 RepID=A0ABN9XNV8_9DINO|nr:unnamed protein product [Polarella glacialis]